MQVNSKRLLDRIVAMNTIGGIAGGGNCRLSLTDEDKAARDLLAVWMREEGLDVKIDELGNMYGIRAGKTSLPALAIGSHLDTVTTGGRYDGTYGVLAGLEVISVLKENKVETERPVVLINFTNEEGARFAPDMMGSLVVSKPHLRDEIWQAVALDNDKASIRSELQRIGYLGTVPCGSIPIAYYLELHIEQGPILEHEQVNIGAVEKVQGIYWTEYILHGQAAHAGTTPLIHRKDPGLLAARINLFLRQLAEEIPTQLGTIGLMEFSPNVINVVPERVRLMTDLRNPDDARLQSAQRKLDDFITAEAGKDGITVQRTERVRLAPVDFSGEVVEQIDAACKQHHLTSRRMVSGAGHDAQMMAAICKAAMIFVPSVNGISHNVKEDTATVDLENGANVLLYAGLQLANMK